MGLLARLRPTEREVYELAIRETDPRRYSEFTPISRGLPFALLSLFGLGVLAVLATPFWLLRSRR